MGGFTSKIKVVPYTDKSFYLGHTSKQNILEGKGKFIDDNGNCYIGMFSDGKYNGYGTMQYLDYDFDYIDNTVTPIFYKGNWKIIVKKVMEN